MKNSAYHNLILIKQDFKCYYCGHEIARVRDQRRMIGVRKSTIDHVVAKIKGGKNNIENLVAACSSCNSKKGAMTAREFIEKAATPTKENDGLSPYRKLLSCLRL